MVAFPSATASTRPLELTVATLVLLLDQVTFRLVAFHGEMVAVKTSESPTSIVPVFLFKETPVTATGSDDPPLNAWKVSVDGLAEPVGVVSFEI